MSMPHSTKDIQKTPWYVLCTTATTIYRYTDMYIYIICITSKYMYRLLTVPSNYLTTSPQKPYYSTFRPASSSPGTASFGTLFPTPNASNSKNLNGASRGVILELPSVTPTSPGTSEPGGDFFFR